jgi:hypothetical protein
LKKLLGFLFVEEQLNEHNKKKRENVASPVVVGRRKKEIYDNELTVLQPFPFSSRKLIESNAKKAETSFVCLTTKYTHNFCALCKK